MSSPAPRSDEDTAHGEFGWPLPAESQRPRAVYPPERRRRRGSAALLLALVGLALALAAGLWYARLDNGPPSQLTVPNVIGMKEGAAIRHLRTTGLAVRSVEMPGEATTGTVFRQRPAAGATLPRGNAVTIDVASGK